MARVIPLPTKFISAMARMEIHKAFERYIREADFPQLADFLTSDPVALKYKVLPKKLLEWREFENSLKLMDTKAEAFLVAGGVQGQVNGKNVSPMMAKFMLTQPKYGYRDKSDVDITSNGERITFLNNVPRPGMKQEPKGRKKRT